RHRLLGLATDIARSLHRDALTFGQRPCSASIHRGLSRPLSRGKAARFTPPRVASRGSSWLSTHATMCSAIASRIIQLDASLGERRLLLALLPRRRARDRAPLRDWRRAIGSARRVCGLPRMLLDAEKVRQPLGDEMHGSIEV